MAAPFGQRGVGNNPFIRPKGGGPNLQGPTNSPFRHDPILQDAAEQYRRQKEFQDWSREQKFNPSQDRRRTPVVPQIRAKDFRRLTQQAWRLANLLARLHPASRFRSILQWLFDWLLDWFLNRDKEVERAGNLGAWSVAGECGAPLPPIGPNVFAFRGIGYPASATTIAQANNCLTGQGTGGVEWPSLAVMSALFPNSQTCSELLHYATTGVGTKRYQVIKRWHRPSTGRLPAVIMRRDEVIDRELIPKVPPPPPAKKVEEGLKPEWPDLIRDIIPDRPPEKEPESDSSPGRSRYTHINYGSKTLTRTRFDEPKRRPPRSREREKKFAGSSDFMRFVHKWASRLKEGVTEADDFIDVFYDALPEHIQKQLKGRKTPQDKAKLIYDNFDKLDWEKVAKNWVENYIEDKAIGTALASSDKAAKVRGESNTIGSRAWLHGNAGPPVSWKLVPR